MTTLSDLLDADDTSPQSVHSDESMESSESGKKARTDLNVALYGDEGGNPLPATDLMIIVDRLYQNFNNIMTDFSPQVGLVEPSLVDVKDTAENNVKGFRESCTELTSELTRISAEWQLMNPQEAVADEMRDLEKAIMRQKEIERRAEERVNEAIDKYRSARN